MASRSLSETRTSFQTAGGAGVGKTCQANGELIAAGQWLRGGDKVSSPVSRAPRGDISQPSPSLADGRNARREHPSRRSFASSEVQTLVLYGPSGCGKSRLIQKLIYSDPTLYTLAVLHTSRKRRLYEVDGRELSFVSQAEMGAGVESGRFVAYTKVTREQSRYGLTRSTSIYDLAEKDDPNGELFGITQEALATARNAEKPIVIINFNPDSAKQLKRAGIGAVYVLLHSGATAAGADEVGADHRICIDQHDEATKALEELARGLVLNVEQQGDKAVEQAKLDWDLVPTLQMSAAASKQLDELRRTVTFAEVLVHVHHVSLAQISGTKAGKATPAKSGAHAPRNSKLSRSLQSEYGIILACAASNLDDADPVHLLTLQTIYKKLTGNRVNCPRIGSHWQDIGFQSSDPADDLQGAGFLGPMQLLYFLDNPRTLSLAQEMRTHFERSTDRVPFCALSLRLTQLALSALKDGLLNKECTKRDQVFHVINEFYLGIMHRCYQLCKARAYPELSVLVVEMGRQTSNKAGVKSLLKDGHTLVAERDRVGHPEMASVSKVAMSVPFDSFSQL